MNKLILLFVLVLTSSCGKLTCECYEYPYKDISYKTDKPIELAKSTICHYDALTGTFTTLSFNNDVKLQEHIDSHGIDDFDTVGECVALGVDEYDLSKPTYYSNDCGDDGIESRYTIVICK